jgi:hypothetical protein
MSETRGVVRSLHTARDVFSPTREQRERVRLALRARLAAEAGSGAPNVDRAASSMARRAVPSRRALALAKSGTLLGIGFALGFWFAERRIEGERVPPGAAVVEDGAPSAGRPSAPGANAPSLLRAASTVGAVPALDGAAAGVAQSTEPQRVTTPPAKEAPAMGVASRAADASPERRVFPARQRSLATTASTLEELVLLQRAERAIRAGDGALARSFVAELESRFPKTTWGEERRAIRVLATCELEEPSAQSDARQFLRRHSASVYFDRVQTLCRLDATPASNAETLRETDGPSLDTDRAEENP